MTRLLEQLGRQMQDVIMEAKDQEGILMMAFLSGQCPGCLKKYKPRSRGWLKRHMEKTGHWYVSEEYE